MTEHYTEGDLVAYVGTDDPQHDLYEGQPGVVVDVGPGPDISIAFASGPTGSVGLSEMARIDMTQYRARADRMRRHRHPLRDEPITLSEYVDGIQDPLESGLGT